jgi:putative ABC transport system permease protein
LVASFKEPAMPDWKHLVRVHLNLPPLHNQRSERIIEEIAGQLEDLYQEAQRHGASSRDAERAAFAQIENWDELSASIRDAEGPNRVSAAEQRREEARDRAMAPRSGLLHRLFGGLGMDVRLGLRRLRAAPTSTAIAVGVLALAIGAGTAVFSVVDAVALRGLPFDEYDRLAAVLETDGKGRLSLTDNGNATPQNYLDWRRMQTVFDGLAALDDQDLRMRNEFNEPATARGLRVSAEFFAVLRVPPFMGRPFRAADEVVGQHRVAILSYAFWQRQFGGAHDVVGRTITFNDEPWQIVGVTPRHFTYPLGGIRQAADWQLARSTETEVYIPLPLNDGERSRARTRHARGARMAGFTVIGRLRPGVSFAQAAERMNVLEAAIDARPGAQVQVRPLNEHLVGSVRAWMVLLLGAVGLVVALACANVANLRLAQAAIAARDVAICAALGASRWRTTRGFLVENLLLAGSSAALGIGLAWGGIHVLARNLPRELPRVAAVAIDLRVLGVAVLSALVTGLLVGLAPAALHLRPRLAEATGSGGSRTTRGRGARRIGNALVVGEVALASLLLVGAGLFVASFARLMRIDPGYDYRHTLALGITTPFPPPQMTLEEQDAVQQRNRATIDQVSSAVRGLPGVLGAEAVDAGAPLSGVRFPWAIVHSAGEPWEQVFSRQRSEDLADRHVVTPGYLALMRVPLLRGRHFSLDDRANTTRVVIINQEAARKYWPGQDALGQHLYGPGPIAPGQAWKFNVEYTVVGIVGNIRHQGPESPPPAQVYFPLTQWPHALVMTLVVRTAGEPVTVVHAVKKAIWSVYPEQRFDDTLTLQAFMDRLTAKRRFLMSLLTLFGALGLVIAGAGVYAMLAHRVVERRREIGVRLALGATPGGVVRMVLGQALVLLGLGLAIGLGAAWQFGTAVKAFLFSTEPADPVVFAVTLVGLGVAGVLAALGPARRASRVDPIVTLRCE